MNARLDAVGNVVGRYEGERPGLALPDARLASRHRARCRQVRRHARRGHRDRMRRGAQRARDARLPFAIEVIGFADEEGVRFNATLLGSRAVAGTLRSGSCSSAPTRRASAMRDALRGFGLDPDAIRRGRAAARRAARLRRAAHRAGSGARGRRSAGRRGHRDQRRQSLRDRAVGHGRPRRHGADATAPRRARRGRRMRARGRAHRRRDAGAGRHRRQDRGARPARST